jgi:hypothetical protein
MRFAAYDACLFLNSRGVSRRIFGWNMENTTEIRVDIIAGARPNAAHVAIARAGAGPGRRVSVVTQNVDGLHQRAHGVPKAFRRDAKRNIVAINAIALQPEPMQPRRARMGDGIAENPGEPGMTG